MPEARVVTSILEVDARRWDACFPGALEGHAYLAAVEASRLSGLDWRYVLVEDEGRLLAAAPAFLIDYQLETTLSPFARQLAVAARRLHRSALTLRLAALGSPCTEDVGVGFHPSVTAAERPGLLRRLIQAFEGDAERAGGWLLALKDAPDLDGLWRQTAAGLGYTLTPGMPSAELAIDFADLDGYLARLSAATRKDMRRKLKARSGLRIERRGDIAGLERRVMELYRQTRGRSDLQFEELTEAYFTGVLQRLGDRASCVLYWAGDDLLGANLLLQDGETLLDKFFCMESARGPAHNLYFVSWFTNVQLCLDAGLRRYRSGQAGYATKLRLGSRLAPTGLYFRHRRPLVDRALRWAAPRLVEDPVSRRASA